MYNVHICLIHSAVSRKYHNIVKQLYTNEKLKTKTNKQTVASQVRLK